MITRLDSKIIQTIKNYEDPNAAAVIFIQYQKELFKQYLHETHRILLC